MKKLTLIICIIVTQFAIAQNNCDCLSNLNHFVSKVSANYSGYKDKVNSKTEAQYNKLVDSLRMETSKSSDLKKCYEILEKYRLFFYDKHLQLSANLPIETTTNATQNNLPNSTNWNAKSINAYFTNKKLNPIEGIWNLQGYEVAVVFNQKDKSYDGIILKS